MGKPNQKQPGRLVTKRIFMFFNNQHLKIRLPSAARTFFDFLCENMRADNNAIIINQDLKREFIEFVSKITSKKKTITLSTINKYITLLKKSHLLILSPGSERGYYIVNPKYVSKGTKRARRELLQAVINEKIANKENLKGLIDFPES